MPSNAMGVLKVIQYTLTILPIVVIAIVDNLLFPLKHIKNKGNSQYHRMRSIIMDSPTMKYLAENNYIMSLKRKVINSNHARLSSGSIVKLIYLKGRNLWGLVRFALEVSTNLANYLKIYKMKNSHKNQKAIVVGNGPSQGLLSLDTMLRFKSNGGRVIVVNFWTENKLLSKCIPDYLVISDPATLTNKDPDLEYKNKNLWAYLLRHKEILLIAPLNRVCELKGIIGHDRVIGFCDSEIRMWSKNTAPVYPRGYLSMTLYKALAMAKWMGFSRIYVIGMDNTYPRNLYCDNLNRILNLEVHAGGEDYISDLSARYHSIAEILEDLVDLFYDAKKFSDETVVNLDPFSLTDAFNKVDSIGNIGVELNN